MSLLSLSFFFLENQQKIDHKIFLTKDECVDAALLLYNIPPPLQLSVCFHTKFQVSEPIMAYRATTGCSSAPYGVYSHAPCPPPPQHGYVYPPPPPPQGYGWSSLESFSSWAVQLVLAVDLSVKIRTRAIDAVMWNIETPRPGWSPFHLALRQWSSSPNSIVISFLLVISIRYHSKQKKKRLTLNFLYKFNLNQFDII